MSRCAALLDANVLYPAPMRDLFLQLSASGLFQAKWSADIHREWIEALRRREPHRERVALERTRELMDRHARDCLVTGYEELIAELWLPDPNDRHVVAAAIVGRCSVIVTQNLRHFPAAELARHKMQAQHSDNFLCRQFELAPGAFFEAVRKVRARLKNPSLSVDDYIETLKRQGLFSTASTLSRFCESL